MGLVAGIRRCAGQISSAIADSAKSEGMHDKMLLKLPGLEVQFERHISDPTPHEVTLVLPRIEIRKTIKGTGTETTEEYVYSSITVVHAPRHPEEGRERPSVSMDNPRALLYTLRRWPTSHSSDQLGNAARGKEADSGVVDRRDFASR